MEHKLQDKHGRILTKLRVSLLDACNMKCIYCMPENPEFMNKREWLSPLELKKICSNLNRLGISEIRLTGGEPTLRDDFIEIVNGLSTIPLKKLALTTNALKLKKTLPDLQQTNLKSINISLDSLNAIKFKKITRLDKFQEVMDSIYAAIEMGFQVKLNTVLMKGVNDNEIDDFVQFSKNYGVNIRFLEVMKIGTMVNQFKHYFISSDEIINILSEKYELTKLTDSHDSTSENYTLNNGAKIGMIASESHAFCGQCTRLRMGPTGIIYPCLFIDKGLSVKNAKFSEYPYILNNLINEKPLERLNQVTKPMYSIGG